MFSHDQLRQKFSCPISKQLFLDPVVAEDGNVYERAEISKWLELSQMSPVTNLLMGPTRIRCFIFNTWLEDFYEKNPEEKLFKYDPRLNHIDHLDAVRDIFQNEQFDRLKNYKKFDLAYIDVDDFCRFINKDSNNSNKIIKYFLDNIFDLDFVDGDGWSIVHYVAECAKPKIISYLMTKDVDLTLVTNDNWTFTHLVCDHSTSDMAKIVIDMNFDDSPKTKNGWTALHTICECQTFDVINHALSKHQLTNVDTVAYAEDPDTKYDINDLIVHNDKLSSSEIVRLIRTIYDIESKNKRQENK